METPEFFAGPRVKGARVARRGSLSLRARETKNDNVAVDTGRRGWPVIDSIEIAIHPFAQVNRSGLAKAQIWPAGLGVQRYQAAIGRPEKNSSLVPVGPISNPA